MRAGHTPRCVAAAVRGGVLGASGRVEVGVFGDGALPGQGTEDLSDDGPFEGAKTALIVQPLARWDSR